MSEAPTTLDRLVGFPRFLRAAGLPVATDRSISFCRAACALDPLDLGSLYWAGRITLTSDPVHVPIYESAFRAYFLGETRSLPDREESTEGRSDPSAEAGPGSREEIRIAAGRGAVSTEPGGRSASEAELLKLKSFEDLTDEERALVARAIKEIKIDQPLRSSRRSRPHRAGTRLNVPQTLRRALRTQGEPVHRILDRPRLRPRPVMMILDVSGSMADYSRALLQFGHAAIRAGGRVEVFTFGTSLTNMTRALSHPDPGVAIARVSEDESHWDEGTLIGESLSQLLGAYSQSASLRGSVVVLCSDGLDRGDPALLASQMARLRRLAHRIVWVNPLKGGPSYEPLARGMKTALPFVDVFLAGHNLASLEELVWVIQESSRAS